MTDRAANNRKIAEWLGWTTKPRRLSAGLIWYAPDGGSSLELPDFYQDETASAAILDRMNTLKDGNGDLVMLYLQGSEKCVYIDRYVNYKPSRFISVMGCTDRKTAIAEACLRLIEREQR